MHTVSSTKSKYMKQAIKQGNKNKLEFILV